MIVGNVACALSCCRCGVVCSVSMWILLDENSCLLRMLGLERWLFWGRNFRDEKGMRERMKGMDE